MRSEHKNNCASKPGTVCKLFLQHCSIDTIPTYSLNAILSSAVMVLCYGMEIREFLNGGGI